MREKFIRGFILILILCFVVIIFSPSSKVSAQCTTSGSQIEVDNGLISALSLNNFKAGASVSCIGSEKAVIPQFALTTYDDMKILYFDQARSSFSKTTLSGDQTQAADNAPINLTSF